MKIKYSHLVIILLAAFFVGTYSFCLAGSSHKRIEDSLKKHMSRVTLKKNIEDGVNTLTQEMLDKHGPYTKFIIKHDYYLSGYITIPPNCELKFKGGSLRNGKVDFNGCKVVSKRKALYNIRFVHLANIDVDLFYIPNDATFFLQDIVNSCSSIDLKNRAFGVNRVISINANKGEYKISNGTIYALPDFEIYEGEGLTPTGTLIYISGLYSGYVYNLTLDGKGIAQKGLYITQSNDVVIDKCIISNCDGADKTMSWGLRCNNCSNIRLTNSCINNIIALPVGKNGGSVGSAAGVVFEHTVNSLITNNTIENIQSTRDGDAIHIISIPAENNKPAPTREDLYETVNVEVSHNIIKANSNSKRCIKVQAFGVKIMDNLMQKLYTNKTNVVSVYGSNVVLENNHIESNEYYTIVIGTSYLATLNDVIIRNNVIKHRIATDWCSCIYVVGSSLRNCSVENNTVDIENKHNSFCDVRGGLHSVIVSNNKVTGGSHFFRIRNEINKAEIDNLQIKGNEFEGNYDLLTIEKDKNVNTTYEEISVFDNTFTGGSESKKMIEVLGDPALKRSVRIGANRSNKSMEL